MPEHLIEFVKRPVVALVFNWHGNACLRANIAGLFLAFSLSHSQAWEYDGIIVFAVNKDAYTCKSSSINATQEKVSCSSPLWDNMIHRCAPRIISCSLLQQFMLSLLAKA